MPGRAPCPHPGSFQARSPSGLDPRAGMWFPGAPLEGPEPLPAPAVSHRIHPMTQNYEKLRQAVEAIRDDVDKAVKGNKAATARVRKAMQEVKAIAQEIRKEMLEMRDAGGAS